MARNCRVMGVSFSPIIRPVRDKSAMITAGLMLSEYSINLFLSAEVIFISILAFLITLYSSYGMSIIAI